MIISISPTNSHSIVYKGRASEGHERVEENRTENLYDMYFWAHEHWSNKFKKNKGRGATKINATLQSTVILNKNPLASQCEGRPHNCCQILSNSAYRRVYHLTQTFSLINEISARLDVAK